MPLPSVLGGTSFGRCLLTIYVVSDTVLETKHTKQDKQSPWFHGIYILVGISKESTFL